MSKEKQPKQQEKGLNVFLVPVSIILAGVVLAVGVLVGATQILNKIKDLESKLDKVFTQVNTLASSGVGQPQAAAPQFDENALYTYASEIGVDSEKFAKCYENKETESELDADLAEAEKLQVSGTPGFIIGKRNPDNTVTGYLFSAAISYENFEEIVSKYEQNDEVFFTEQLDSYGHPFFRKSTVKIDSDDPYLGNLETSPLVIVSFLDYECPACQYYYSLTHNTIIENYVRQNKLAYVVKDMPLSFHEPNASKKALAAQCIQTIAGSEAYFKYHDLLFENLQ